MTYSIVARDPSTGELGAAVQSRAFGVWRCIWAESGVGAVATQSFTDAGYGSLGLELLRRGKTAGQALAALRTADELEGFRQVGMVDARGESATHTGAHCIDAAGGLARQDLAAQANIMASEGVWPAMAEAFEAAEGALALRLLAALEAAQGAGGDWRGQQAAALVVVAGETSGRPWDDWVANLRVEDSREPLAELRRLLELADAYRQVYEPGSETTVEEAVAAAEAAGLGEPELTWAALGAAAGGGDPAAARARLDRLLELEPRYLDLVRRRRRLAEAAGIEPLPDAP